MPIKSYLVYPVASQKKVLEASLRALSACTIFPAANQDLLILVTDTPNETAEKELEAQLKEIPSLQCLALVSGYRDPEGSVED